MMQFNQEITLYDKLNDINDEENIDRVKEIIFSLSKINKLKYLIEKNLKKETLYDDIFLELKAEFNIGYLYIKTIKNERSTILYESGNSNVNLNKYINISVDNTTIEVLIENKNYTEYESIALNTYFKEISHLIYMQYILKSFDKNATIDHLTKLQNRISFYSEMKILVPLAIREKMQFGVILLNIDRFRAVNDEHGNEFGDEFLKLYANNIKKMIRSSDIAVRFTGGEFLIILVNVDTEDRTIELAKKIQDELSSVYLMSPFNDKFKKTVCAGVSMFPKDSSDINEVIKFSEMAMSDARDRGRNKLTRYKPECYGKIDIF